MVARAGGRYVLRRRLGGSSGTARGGAGAAAGASRERVSCAEEHLHEILATGNGEHGGPEQGAFGVGPRYGAAALPEAGVELGGLVVELQGPEQGGGGEAVVVGEQQELLAPGLLFVKTAEQELPGLLEDDGLRKVIERLLAGHGDPVFGGRPAP